MIIIASYRIDTQNDQECGTIYVDETLLDGDYAIPKILQCIGTLTAHRKMFSVERSGDMETTRPLTVNSMDAWAMHDCLASALAGFSGRHETAEPWHAISLMQKLRSVLLTYEQEKPTMLVLELSKGELECIDLNVPRTAYQGATALLLRVFHALTEFDYNLPILAENPDLTVQMRRLTSWQDGQGDPSIRA